MKPHGINADLTYEIIDSNILKSEKINSKLEGWINFENLKTGMKATLPFRSFVDNFLQTIHGLLTGDHGADTRIQSVSCVASNANKASCGLLLGTSESLPLINDTTITDQITNASLFYNTHSFEAPSYSGYTSKFAFSRVIANEYSTAFYPTQVGIKTKSCSTVGVPSVAGASRLISKDALDFVIQPDESVRITFTFNAAMNPYTGGIVMNFVKLIYNALIKGNLNHNDSKIVSRTGTTPTYYHASIASFATLSATLGEVFVGSSGSGYIGIVLVPWSDLLVTPYPGAYAITPDHTGFTVSANTVSAIEYTTIGNGANFSITRTFTNTGTTTKKIGKIGLLTRGDSANVTGATLNANQALLMDNRPESNYIEIAPNQVLKVTYNFGIQV